MSQPVLSSPRRLAIARTCGRGPLCAASRTSNPRPALITRTSRSPARVSVQTSQVASVDRLTAACGASATANPYPTPASARPSSEPDPSTRFPAARQSLSQHLVRMVLPQSAVPAPTMSSAPMDPLPTVLLLVLATARTYRSTRMLLSAIPAARLGDYRAVRTSSLQAYALGAHTSNVSLTANPSPTPDRLSRTNGEMTAICLLKCISPFCIRSLRVGAEGHC